MSCVTGVTPCLRAPLSYFFRICWCRPASAGSFGLTGSSRRTVSIRVSAYWPRRSSQPSFSRHLSTATAALNTTCGLSGSLATASVIRSTAPRKSPSCARAAPCGHQVDHFLAAFPAPAPAPVRRARPARTRAIALRHRRVVGRVAHHVAHHLGRALFHVVLQAVARQFQLDVGRQARAVLAGGQRRARAIRPGALRCRCIRAPWPRRSRCTRRCSCARPSSGRGRGSRRRPAPGRPCSTSVCTSLTWSSGSRNSEYLAFADHLLEHLFGGLGVARLQRHLAQRAQAPHRMRRHRHRLGQHRLRLVQVARPRRGSWPASRRRRRSSCWCRPAPRGCRAPRRSARA